MEQQDYLMKQIEAFGQVLGELAAKLLGLKSPTKTIEICQKTFSEELDLDFNKLITIPTDDLIKFLKNEKRFSNANLRQIADIFHILAEDLSKSQKATFNEKSIKIYEFIDKKEKTFSFIKHRFNS
ncbi:MAG: hypothetical protein LBT56_04330 [Prevotellaceae bacterium]|jgi:hypothetical protein|nr:hypothetical protein [Prevotellaceae bacterium]